MENFWIRNAYENENWIYYMLTNTECVIYLEVKNIIKINVVKYSDIIWWDILESIRWRVWKGVIHYKCDTSPINT